MRQWIRLIAWTVLVAALSLADAQAQFDDFPDDAHQSPAAPAPRAPTAPAPTRAPAPARPALPNPAPAAPSQPSAPEPAAPPTARPQQPAPAPAAPAQQASTPVLAPAAALDASAHALRLANLRAEVAALEEEVFRSKVRLSHVAETVLEALAGGARAKITHEDAMGPSYRLVRASYAIDGMPIFDRADDEEGLSEVETFDVYEGSLVPGEHSLTVTLEYRGHGFGAFSYLRGYRYRTQSTYVFTAEPGQMVGLRVTGFEEGGADVALEDRPAIRFGQRLEAADASAQPAPGQATSAD